MATNNRRIFTVSYSGLTILPGATAYAAFGIPLNGFEVKVRSFSWEWYCRDNVTNKLINQYNNNTQELNLFMQAVNGLPLASVANAIGVPAPSDNGVGFRFYNPGHVTFDSFYCQNDIAVYFSQTNRDLVNSYIYAVTITAEIEIIPIA